MIFKKLKSENGESLVEVFAAILIASLSVAFLTISVMTAVNMNRAAESADKRYYDSITAAETKPAPTDGSAPPEGKVTIQGNGSTKIYDISFYGGDGMYSYQKK